MIATSGTSLRLSPTAASQLVSCQSKLLSTTKSPINNTADGKAVQVEQFTLPDLSHNNRLVEPDRFEQLDLYTQQPCCSIQEVSEHQSKLGGKDGSCEA